VRNPSAIAAVLPAPFLRGRCGLAGKRSSRNWGNAVPWFALVIAAYGAVLSTVQWRNSQAEKARRLEVTLAFGSPVAKGVLFPRGLQFKASNPGYQVVTVAAAGLFLPNGSRLWFGRGEGDWRFPKAIGPGENAGILWAGQDLVTLCDSLVAHGCSGPVTLVGFCQDGLGGFHTSEPLKFDVAEARKLAPASADTPGPGAGGPNGGGR
jgi:hypothetical protein